MDQLAFERDQKEIADQGARTLRNIVIVNAIVLAIGVVLGTVAPAAADGSVEPGRDRTLQDGARPQPGRRF